MTDDGEIEALVRRLCAARVAGDMDVLRRGYADNATFRIAGSPAWGALTAPLTGHAKIMSRFESMIANLALSDLPFSTCSSLATKLPFAGEPPCAMRKLGRVHHRNRAIPGSRAWPSDFPGRVP